MARSLRRRAPRLLGAALRFGRPLPYDGARSRGRGRDGMSRFWVRRTESRPHPLWKRRSPWRRPTPVPVQVPGRSCASTRGLTPSCHPKGTGEKLADGFIFTEGPVLESERVAPAVRRRPWEHHL